jgi:thiopurine S-methyltransferase
MDAVFWRERWREGRTAFNEGAPNAFLSRHVARLVGRRVLVPLCGKAEDLAFLAFHGHDVVGVELVEQAVREFFAEHGLVADMSPQGAATAYSAASIRLLAGDMFAITREDTGAIDAIYDRAALVALPPDMRQRYVAHLRSIVAPGTHMLIVTIDYPQSRMDGPPFAVSDNELRGHYREVELLDERPAKGGRLEEMGVVAVERCYAAVV